MEENNTCIYTYSGPLFDFKNPHADMIRIEDIARGLSNSAHFGGQTKQYFSIAQHCMLVYELMPTEYMEDYTMGMAALLHDASEAYTGDMLKPLKNMLPEFKKIEDRIMEVIFTKYDLPLETMRSIKVYDMNAQDIEFRALMRREIFLTEMTPQESYDAFMEVFNKLINLKIDENETQSI